MIAQKNQIVNFMRIASFCFIIFMLMEGMKLLQLTHQQVEDDKDVDYCSFNTLTLLFAVSLAAIVNTEHLIQIGIA